MFVSRSDVCVGLFCNTADRFARLSVWLAGAYCLVVFTVSVGLSRASQDGLHKHDVRGVRVGLLVWPCRFKVVCVWWMCEKPGCRCRCRYIYLGGAGADMSGRSASYPSDLCALP